MKKIFIAVILGALFSVTACNDDGSMSPGTGDTTTAKQDTVPVSPQDTIPLLPQPADTTVVPTDTTVVAPPTPNPPVLGNPYFSSSDSNLVAALKDLIPLDIVLGFEEKYTAWENTWISGGVGSRTRDYAQSEEYDNLLRYCGHYGKAVWPLIIAKFVQSNVVFANNLLEDLTYTREESIYTYVETTYQISETDKRKWSVNFVFALYSQDLLAREEANIRKAIQEVSASGYDKGFEMDATFGGQEILISLNSSTDANAYVKISYYYYPSYGILYAADHDVSKGKQTIRINTANFRIPPDIQVGVSVYINGKVMFKRVTIES